MFNVLTTSYLFLGGTGAGALAVLCVLECARVLRWRALAMPEEFFARAWPVCAVTLATGMLCLLADLGRPDRLLGLLSSPTPSAMAAGSFALVAALACAAAFSLGALLDDAALYARMAAAPDPYGDGHAAERIRAALREAFGRA